MEKIVLPKCENGKFTQYHDDEAVIYFDIRGKFLDNIQILSNYIPKYIVLPPISKTKNFVTNFIINEFALSNFDNPVLIYTGRGNTKIDFPAKQNKITVVLPKDKSLYLVKEEIDTGNDIDTNYYYLISDKNFQGFHEMGRRELSVKQIDRYDIMGREIVASNYKYDRKLVAIIKDNEQQK